MRKTKIKFTDDELFLIKIAIDDKVDALDTLMIKHGNNGDNARFHACMRLQNKYNKLIWKIREEVRKNIENSVDSE